jgi:hypothetical protein
MTMTPRDRACSDLQKSLPEELHVQALECLQVHYHSREGSQVGRRRQDHLKVNYSEV